MISTVKSIISACLFAIFFSSCGVFKKKEVGPYGDQRSRWQKMWDFEEEHYDGWAEKVMHRDEYKRRKKSPVVKRNP